MFAQNMEECRALEGVDEGMAKEWAGSVAARLAKGSLRCERCDWDDPSDLWLNVHSGVLLCGRKARSHMLSYYEQHRSRSVAVNVQSGMTWDYSTDKEVISSEEAKEMEGRSEAALYSVSSCGWLEDVRRELRGEDAEDEMKEVKPLTKGGEGASFMATAQKDEPVDEAGSGGLSGLHNLGNTCYLNSALQSLSNVPIIARTLAEVPFYSVDAGDLDRPTIAVAMQDFVVEQWRGEGGTLTPRFVLQQLRRQYPMFHGYNQQDAQEALKFMLMNAHESTALQIPIWRADSDGPVSRSFESGPARGDVEDAGAASERPWETSGWLRQGPFVPRPSVERSPVSDAFRGVLASRVRCRSCAYESITMDHFFDLSLPIPDEPHPLADGNRRAQGACPREETRARGFGRNTPSALGCLGRCFSRPITLQDCLYRFCDADALTGSDQFACPKCKRKRDADKAMAIARLPEVMCLHLKRFSAVGGWMGKVSTLVRFPLDTLDMAPFLFPEAETCARENVQERAQRRANAAAAARREARRMLATTGDDFNDAEFAPPPGKEDDDDKEDSSTPPSDVPPATMRRKSSKRRPSVAPPTIPALVLRGGAPPPILSDTPSSDSIAEEILAETERRRILTEAGVRRPPDDSGTQYELVALVQHMGVMGGGHYVAYCKRRLDNKWYLFNDASVVPTASDRVAHREAYLLFYVRKRPSPPLLRAPTAPTPHCYVSKSWWIRFRSGHYPGPLSAAEIACPHGNIRKQLLARAVPEQHCVPLSLPQTKELVELYGREGSLIPHPIGPCVLCANEARALQERRKRELVAIRKVDTKHIDKDRGDVDGCWYLMDARWLDNWNKFVNQANPLDNDPDGTHRGLLPPGPVDNSRLLHANGKPRKNLKPVTHYRGVNGRVYRFFVKLYGGGPMLRRRTIDIYDEPLDPIPPDLLGELPDSEDEEDDEDEEEKDQEEAKLQEQIPTTPSTKRAQETVVSPLRESIH